MTQDGRNISIVVPTFREAPNLTPLCKGIMKACATADLAPQIVFVDDDSKDGSEEIVRELALEYPVEMLVRKEERGLSSAVLAGFELAKHDCLLVMDADLQHPPEQIPDVVRPILEGRADICVGSRYVASGELDEGWPFLRRLNSYAATALARPLTSVKDSMAGFFALNRRVWQECPPLNPLGYKILLELLAKAPRARVKEVPISFGQRYAGESKLQLSEQILYLRHLARLYRHRFPRLLPLAIIAAMVITVLALLLLVR